MRQTETFPGIENFSSSFTDPVDLFLFRFFLMLCYENRFHKHLKTIPESLGMCATIADVALISPQAITNAVSNGSLLMHSRRMASFRFNFCLCLLLLCWHLSQNVLFCFCGQKSLCAIAKPLRKGNYLRTGSGLAECSSSVSCIFYYLFFGFPRFLCLIE